MDFGKKGSVVPKRPGVRQGKEKRFARHSEGCLPIKASEGQKITRGGGREGNDIEGKRMPSMP